MSSIDDYISVASDRLNEAKDVAVSCITGHIKETDSWIRSNRGLVITGAALAAFTLCDIITTNHAFEMLENYGVDPSIILSAEGNPVHRYLIDTLGFGGAVAAKVSLTSAVYLLGVRMPTLRYASLISDFLLAAVVINNAYACTYF